MIWNGIHKASNDNLTIILKAGVLYLNNLNLNILLHFSNNAPPAQILIVKSFVNSDHELLFVYKFWGFYALL